MSAYFAYIRVSDPKQERGASLPEQREDIERFAARRGLTITRWFTESRTAAKAGRPAFSEMLRLLKSGRADGAIFHKIDRSSRNRTEWAGINELFDSGVDVLFAHEGVDMHTRSGRVAADVQAMLAVNYIDNLRDEVRKGQRGRVKQGLYPWAAPPGYRNNGEGAVKTIDPVQGPLAQQAFELYATGRFNKQELAAEMRRRGLRMHRKDGAVPVTKNGIASMLRNPFYIGLIRVKRWDETFKGTHEPLISKRLFDRVQALLDGKAHTKTIKNDFVFRRMVPCPHCGRNLVGEIQKARYVYYRCHTDGCTVSIPERTIIATVCEALIPLQFSDAEASALEREIERLVKKLGREQVSQTNTIELQLRQTEERLMRLTDAFVDGDVERDIYRRRKEKLLQEQVQLDEAKRMQSRDARHQAEELRVYLELARTALLSYELGSVEEKRDLLREVTSNWCVDGKKVSVELRSPYREIAARNEILFCGEQRTVPRTPIGVTTTVGGKGDSSVRGFVEALFDAIGSM